MVLFFMSFSFSFCECVSSLSMGLQSLLHVYLARKLFKNLAEAPASARLAMSAFQFLRFTFHSSVSPISFPPLHLTPAGASYVKQPGNPECVRSPADSEHLAEG